MSFDMFFFTVADSPIGSDPHASGSCTWYKNAEEKDRKIMHLEII